MNKWIAEFELEDGDIMPEHMDLEYKGAKIDFHCRPLEQEPILDKIKTDIAKFADTIPFVSGDIKAKYANIGQHDGLEQALEIIEGNIKGDFDIDEWMAENE